MIENLSPSARAFSDLIGESATTTHNYTSQRNAEPRAGYLSKVLFHFKDIDARWLLTGEGEAFLPGTAEPVANYQNQAQNQKKNRGHIINHTGNGPATYTLEDCRREREVLQTTCDQQKDKIQLLQANIEDLRKALATLAKP